MDTNIWTVLSMVDGEHAITTHRTQADAEAEVRRYAVREYASTRAMDPLPEDIFDVLTDLADGGIDVYIDSHPLRGIATDTSGIDQALLAKQIADLAEVIARCDDDAASTLVTISDTEAESLEGLYNLAASLWDGTELAT